MALTSSPVETDAGGLAAMAKVPVERPTPHATTLPRGCLYVWVVGNPISGGKQGATVLNRIETLFRQSFGEGAVHKTSSSGFLHNLSPRHHLPSSATSLPSAVNALWDSLAAATPTRPADSSPSPAPSCASEVAVRTVIIWTDQGGHSKKVSHALSQLILSSRLGNDPQLLSRRQRSPSTQHILLVVGGDGTLSEITNGLCEGTLAEFAQLAPSSSAHTNAATTTSHAHVECEAAVLSHLLPAVLYVPGGTGSDFAKFGLCCRTAEDALRVVHDGLVHQLFSGAGKSCGDGRSHRDTEACGVVTLSSPAAEQCAPTPPALPTCAAHAVDIGRIEFLRTGTRHFFINECSAGMSCSVIQRGERFKRCRWISMLGGLLLFAASAFVSLLLMAPKPLYICKLPLRVPLSVASTALMEGYDIDSGAGETDESHEQLRRKSSGIGDSNGGSAGLCNSCQDRKPTSATSSPDALSASPQELPHSLVALAPFASLRTQLDRLCALLRRSVCIEPGAPAPGHRLADPSHTCASPFTQEATTASEDENRAAAYAQHARAAIPPPSANTVRCTFQTPTDKVLQLLDISSDELELHRMQQQQPKRHRTGVPVVNLNSELTVPITSTKVMGEGVIGKDAASAASSDDDEKLCQYIRRKLNGQISGDDSISESHLRVNSGAVGVSGGTRTGLVSASVRPLDITGDGARPHNVGDDVLSSLTWVELPSSMIAFANGRWYGGGMLVAPHANPEDGLLSCTNWVATILPFIAGVRSIYTGRHVYWRSTTAFDGARFLITNVPPPPPGGAMTGPMDSRVGASSDAGEELYVEADGEVLEAAPAIVELAGKITFLVPRTTTVHYGNAAPGTTRERLATQKSPRKYGSVASPLLGRRVRWLRDGLGLCLRRLANYAQQWCGKGNRKRIMGSSNMAGACA
ncbi:hypothetical protein CUR178_06463 [Leishmania enriettii]|uniref:DAGKc domain-containing protein n=1 Tax=Leishmania enriettii TaxID=5663 RepID=A0A836GTV6_LEIEN|nr:hypothetical protein CUR178_06463 [Leishmania enriettii]